MAVCWALLLTACSATSNAQDVTGNLIYTTINPPPPGSVYSWGGFVNTESGGGGLDGGHVPGYNGSLGQFMFGYMPGTVNYSMAVSSALSGTGLRVTGIQYGLEYFNQDYSRGSLSATWSLRDSSGKVLESYYHAFGPTTEGWTKFDQTKTFASPYSLASVGNLDFSITGSDDRFWAGYYGPQVRNPYARLTYGADLCATDPMSSPSCPGYLDTINKLLPAQPTTITTTAAAAEAPAATAVTSPVPASTELLAPVSTNTTTATTASTVSATSAATSVTPSATNPQPRAGEITVSGSQPKTTPSTAQILSIVRTEQSRVSAVETIAAESAVSQAQTQSQQAQEQTMAVSSAVMSQSQFTSQTTMASTSAKPQSIYAITPQTMVVGVAVLSTGLSVNAPPMSRSSEEPSSGPVLKLSGTDPVSNAITAQPSAAATQEPFPGPSVNRSAQDNDAAGGVTLAAMARTPQGFEAYMGMLPDTRFYAPREIYRGQRVVDNARVERALSGASDRLHQDMVNQQYRKGQ